MGAVAGAERHDLSHFVGEIIRKEMGTRVSTRRLPGISDGRSPCALTGRRLTREEVNDRAALRRR